MHLPTLSLIHPMLFTLKRYVQRRGNRFVIALATLAVLLSACVTSPDVGADVDTDTSVDVAGAIGTRAEPASTPVECSGADCYMVIVNDSWIPATRASGAAWDADGSLPEPYVALSLNGHPLGTTTTLTESQLLHYASIGAYRARWNEAVSTVDLHTGDVLHIEAYDAQERYSLGKCDLTITAQWLAAGQIACVQDAASLYITFASNP